MSTTKIKSSNITDGSITSDKFASGAISTSLGYTPADVTRANSAFNQANSAFNQANTAINNANSASSYANVALTTAQAAFTQANTVDTFTKVIEFTGFINVYDNSPITFTSSSSTSQTKNLTKSLYVNEISETITLPNLSMPMTIEGWFYNADDNNYAVVFELKGTNNQVTNITADGGVYFNDKTGTYGGNAGGNANTIGGWHHFVFYTSTTGYTTWVDGVRIANGTYPVVGSDDYRQTNPKISLGLGASFSTNIYWKPQGYYDQVKITAGDKYGYTNTTIVYDNVLTSSNAVFLLDYVDTRAHIQINNNLEISGNLTISESKSIIMGDVTTSNTVANYPSDVPAKYNVDIVGQFNTKRFAFNSYGGIGLGTTSSTSTGSSGQVLTSGGEFGAVSWENITVPNASTQVSSLGVGTAASGTTGEIRATDDITAFYSSDINLKENIDTIKNALNIVNCIGGKTFDWTDEYIKKHGGEDGYFIQKSDFGVIAQDVQKVFPKAVRTRLDGTLAVDYAKLVALSFAAIVELTEKVNKLEGK